MCSQSETKLYNGSDKDVSASGGKLTKKESLKVKNLKLAPLKKYSRVVSNDHMLASRCWRRSFLLVYRSSWSPPKSAIPASPNVIQFCKFLSWCPSVRVAHRCRRKTTERRRRGPPRSCSAPSRTPRSSSWPTGWRWECECGAQKSFYTFCRNIRQVVVKYNKNSSLK